MADQSVNTPLPWLRLLAATGAAISAGCTVVPARPYVPSYSTGGYVPQPDETPAPNYAQQQPGQADPGYGDQQQAYGQQPDDQAPYDQGGGAPYAPGYQGYGYATPYVAVVPVPVPYGGGWGGGGWHGRPQGPVIINHYGGGGSHNGNGHVQPVQPRPQPRIEAPRAQQGPRQDQRHN